MIFSSRGAFDLARINIEDQFWIEVTAVSRALKGDDSRAVGDAVRLFRIAQQRAKKGQIVTDEDWRIAGFSDALIGVFATKVEGGYEVAGARKHFSWLETRVEAGRKGGEKSGESRRSKINNLGEANRSKTEQAEPSPSFSPSTDDYISSNTTEKDSGRAGGGGSNLSFQEVWGALNPEKVKIWNTTYPDDSFIANNALACYLHYTSPGEDTPRAIVGWEKAFAAWLGKNWVQFENRKALNLILSNVGKVVPMK